MNLVNSQIITVNTDSNLLNLSDPIITIIDVCHNNQYTISVPPDVEKQICTNGIIFSDNRIKEMVGVKEAILQCVLPNVEQYAKRLDFIIKEYTGEEHNG